MKTQLRPLLVIFFALTLLTGIVYPVVVTAVSQSTMPFQAEGSMVERQGHVVGSLLIGQNFADPKYVWGRLSATTPMPNNAANSGGSNLGPLNPALLDAVRGRLDALKAADPDNTAPVPVDLVTASGSGLDPDISVAAALYQAPRVARQRGLAPAVVAQLIAGHAQGSLLGFLGEPRVNVLALNLALDEMHP